MTVRDLYRSMPFVVGLVFVVLGTVNSIVGMTESNKYQRTIRNAVETGRRENQRDLRDWSQQQNEHVMSRLNEAQAQYNTARVRLDFFHVVFTGGQVLLLIGVITISYALIRIIRHDSSVRIEKISRKERSGNHLRES